MMVIAEFSRHLTQAEWAENGSEKNGISLQRWESVIHHPSNRRLYIECRAMGFLTHALGRILSKRESLGDVSLPPGVSVGRRTYGHNSGTFLFYSGSDRVTLGKFCSIGNGVKILCGGEHRTDVVSTYPLETLLTIADGNNYDATTKGPTLIGNDGWIGAGALILSGVKIGDGAVIGSGSVVASDIPPYTVAYGNPAKVTRSRFSSSQRSKFLYQERVCTVRGGPNRKRREDGEE